VFDRSLLPASFPSDEELTGAMVALGMRFAAKPAHEDTNIEDVLLGASWAGIVDEDLRTLAVLTTWIGVHNDAINVDRMTRLVRGLPVGPLRAYWVGVAQWLGLARKDTRWRRLAELWPGRSRLDLVEGSEFLLARGGEDPRFAGGPLRVPAGVLRDRTSDVDTPAEVARRHPAYRARVMMGSRYRSDMWVALDSTPELSAAELARLTYGSYATAVDVKRRHEVVGSSDGGR
jgi:hypothetical protein